MYINYIQYNNDIGNGAVTLRVRGPAFGCVQNTQLNVSERN